MIAASDPQEFIPRGRQQVTKHPGSMETCIKSEYPDDCIQIGLQRVSLSEESSTEYWIMRSVPEDEINNRTKDANSMKTEFSKKKAAGPMNESNIFDCSHLLNESRISDGNTQNTKRTSDASVKNPNKRFHGRVGKGWNDTLNTGKFDIQAATLNPNIQDGLMEDELYVKGNTAVWSRGFFSTTQTENGRKVVSCYTVPGPIKQALWTTFQCDRPTFDPSSAGMQMKTENTTATPTPAICLVESHNLRIFVRKGEQYVLPMPFCIEKVWTTKYGILVEKTRESPVEEKYGINSHSSIFSLSYPLDDVCPIFFNHNNYSTMHHKIVWTNENPSICLVFDMMERRHILYRIRPIKVDDRVYGSHSMAHSSHKLKSRNSMWENLMSNTTMGSPQPMKPNCSGRIFHPQKSRSFSSMAAISRCQSLPVNEVQNLWVQPKDCGCVTTPQDKSFFNCSKSMSHLRSNPALCLEYLWMDSMYNPEGTDKPASSVFLSTNLIGQTYLCYLHPSTEQLSLVEFEISSDKINFGMASYLHARDAINIPHLNMMAVMETSGNVTLYSGRSMVGKLHIGGTLLQHTPSPFVRRQMISPFPRRSSLLPLSKQTEPKFDEHLISPVLPPPSNHMIPNKRSQVTHMRHGYQTRGDRKAYLTGLIDSLDNRLTLQYSDHSFYRISIPRICYSTLVEHCLEALKRCLPNDLMLQLACKWYAKRNSIGTGDMSSREEWTLFSTLLLEQIGYEQQQCLDTPDQPVTKRPKTIYSGGDSDFITIKHSPHSIISDSLSQLLRIPTIRSASHSSEKKGIEEKPQNQQNINSKSILCRHARYVHFTLHLLYEEFKLNNLYTECLLSLASLLSKLSSDLGLNEYAQHYWRDFPKYIKLCNQKINEAFLNSTSIYQMSHKQPPSIMDHISKQLRGESVMPYPYLVDINTRSKNVIQLCSTLAEVNRGYARKISCKKECHDSKKDSTATLERATIEEFVLSLVEMKIDSRYIETFPTGIYFLLYNALWKCRENPPSDWPSDAYHLLWRDDLVAQAQKIEMEKDKLFQEKMNICFQLQESMPNTKQEIADLDGMEDIDSCLSKMRFSDDTRVLEARKMLSSSKPVPINLTQRPEVSDHDFIEEQEKYLYGICIRTMALPVGRGMITLRTTTPIITEPLAAPSLCLTGKVPRRGNIVELNHIDTPANINMWPLFHNGVANGLRITPDAQNIDNTWILFNKPKGGAEPLIEHAGFLMALGLNGHLKNLAVINTFDYIGKSHEITSVGIMLGLAAAHRGTCDQTLTKILAIHVEALLPPTSMDLDISQNLQVSGLLGIGLLYENSAHRHITEVLLSEIGRPPGPEMENSVDRESYSLAAGLALGLVMLKHGDKPTGMSDLNVSDTLHYYMAGGNKRPLAGSQKDKYKTPSFQIREGTSVNLDVTAPGATLALGLMYMGTNNKAIADWMSPPETQYLLDFVRPDFLMLRTLCRALIMLDDIKPCKEWVLNEVPCTILPYCMVTPANENDVDYEAMNQAYCNIVAGACFAIGLKYAGSANKEAFDTLMFFCYMFTSLSGKSIAELAGKATIETCLNVLLLSSAMIMAGTGNLEIMRLVRSLRRRVGLLNSAIVTYGSHLAIHMSLGLLFLGGGRYTLSNSPSSIAAMICAFYPKFPTHSNDNRYHLQAFRHLYVLAVEPRLVIPKDVLFDDICYANIRLVDLDGNETVMKAPGLIPDIKTLKKVVVEDERYWPIVFERNRNWNSLAKILSTTGYIEVKQRAGCLSYVSDKFGYRSDLARTLTGSKLVPWDPPFTSIIHFTSEESIQKLCESVLNFKKVETSHSEQRFIHFLTRATYDAVVKDKLMAIVVVISLLKWSRNMQSQLDTLGIWQMKIITQQVLLNNTNTDLISKDVILALQQEMITSLESEECTVNEELSKYILGEILECSNQVLSEYVTYFDVPFNSRLLEITSPFSSALKIRKLLPNFNNHPDISTLMVREKSAKCNQMIS